MPKDGLEYSEPQRVHCFRSHLVAYFGHETSRLQVTVQSKLPQPGIFSLVYTSSVCAQLRWYRDACPAATVGAQHDDHGIFRWAAPNYKTVAQTFKNRTAHDKRGATIENSGSVAEKRLPFAENPFIACTTCWIFSTTMIP